MSRKHDENKDLRSLARIAKIDFSMKAIKCSKNATIGIRTWGRIDYLTKYCGWHFIWDNSAGNSLREFSNDEVKTSVRKQKKEAKAPKLTNKKK